MAQVRRMAAYLLILAAGSVLLPVSAVAQFSLSKALWDETISLPAGNESVSLDGADPYAPEPHS